MAKYRITRGHGRADLSIEAVGYHVDARNPDFIHFTSSPETVSQGQDKVLTVRAGDVIDIKLDES